LVRLLEAARKISDWPTPLAQRAGAHRGRGIACNIYHGETHMAQIAEMSIDQSHHLTVDRILCVLDLGQPLNLLGIEDRSRARSPSA